MPPLQLHTNTTGVLTWSTNPTSQSQPHQFNFETLLINITSVALAAASLVIAYLHFQHQKPTNPPVQVDENALENLSHDTVVEQHGDQELGESATTTPERLPVDEATSHTQSSLSPNRVAPLPPQLPGSAQATT